MYEQLGYLSILWQTIELISLIGFLILFFLERSSYGRDSIGTPSWPMVLLYDLVTAGAYAVYWRLKVTYALYSRDRLSTLEWVLILAGVFILYMTVPWIWWLLTIWDFVIRHNLKESARIEMGWFRVLFLGHLYLASATERYADLLPLDFRTIQPERRKKIVQVYSLCSLCALFITALGYLGLVEWRKSEFAKIPHGTVDRSGYWQQTGGKYDSIYHLDNRGHKIIYSLGKDERHDNSFIWLTYSLDTKIHDGYVYNFSWFTCITKDRVVESSADTLVVKSADGELIKDVRIDVEEFGKRRGKFIKLNTAARGWKLGNLLKSPWNCELDWIRTTWEQASNFIRKTWQQALVFILG